MISATEKSLYAFWSGFGLSAYKSGEVDPDAPLPYIVYTVEDGDSMSETVLTAYVYVTEDQLSTRRRVLDEITLAVPYQGVRLSQNLVLYRNGGNWISLGKDAEDVPVLWGRVSVQANFY